MDKLTLLAYDALPVHERMQINHLIKSKQLPVLAKVFPPPERLTDPSLHHRRLAQAMRDANPIYVGVPRLLGTGVRKVRGQELYSFVHKGNKYAHPSRRQAKKHLKLLGGMQVPDDDEQDAQEAEDRTEEDFEERVRDYLESKVPEDMINNILRAVYNNDEVDEMHALSDEDLHAQLDYMIREEETASKDIISDKLNTLGIGRQNTDALIEFLINQIGLSTYAISTLSDRAIRRHFDEMMRDPKRKYRGGKRH
jgi:hypothetical protein